VRKREGGLAVQVSIGLRLVGKLGLSRQPMHCTRPPARQ
jgi:hypothetical protein